VRIGIAQEIDEKIGFAAPSPEMHIRNPDRPISLHFRNVSHDYLPAMAISARRE
jgi:hypothetical protein